MTLADGIDSSASPVLAIGGVPGLDPSTQILDYIFHDGAHWVLWIDPSVDGHLGTTFPPPANHTLNMTRISADGSSVVDYPLDTNYAWSFGAGSRTNPGLNDHWTCGTVPFSRASPVWSHKAFFSRWDKPVYSATLASDGTNLWVAVVTAETVDYPYIDNKDAHGSNPGGAAQATPLATLTSGFTVFATSTATGYLRYYTNPTGPLNIFKPTAYPLTDAGIFGMGVHNPPVVVMFAWDGSGFTRIGEIDANYCPSVIQHTGGYDAGGAIIGGSPLTQKGPRGDLWSRIALAASPVDPGVCHAVWSEGGDWGRVADGDPCATGPFGGSRFVWDGGAPSRDYRVNYTTWDPSGKTSDTDLVTSHVDRTSWFFPNDNDSGTIFDTGYTWPAPADFAGLLCFDLRNDNAAGTPLLFCTFPQSLNAWDGSHQGELGPPPAPNDSHGNPWLDYTLVYGDTLYVYDITGGTMTLQQSIDPSLLPNETEAETAYPPASYAPPNFTTPFASDCLYCADDIFGGHSSPRSTFGPQDKAFGISLVYDDPLDGSIPVYLVHVPWARRFTGTPDFVNTNSGQFRMRGFYRVPADMSAAFDFLDGTRLYDFTVLKDPLDFSFRPLFGSSDFFSDPGNIWVPVPVSGQTGRWYDRVCTKGWDSFDAATVPPAAPFAPASAAPGFNYDSGADTISYVAFDATAVDLFEVVVLQICRACRCGGGMYIWTYV